MTANSGKETGFALIVAMIILAVLSVLVINAMRGTTLSERMAFSYMDRALAQQVAEQALREGGGVLIQHADICARNVDDTSILGCVVSSTGVVTAATAAGGALPIAWSATNAVTMNAITAQNSSAKYVIQLLNTSTTNCWFYSIMAEGTGRDSNTKVVLQTVARLCSL